MSHWSDVLAPGQLHACREAREWCATQPSWPEAWAACERADWLLWCQRWSDLGGPWDRRRVPLLLCLAEILDLHPTAHRARAAVALRAWCAEDSEVTRAAVMSAASYDAAARAADDAADDAAAYAAAYADRRAAHLRMCEIVRRHFPTPPVLGGVA